MHWPYNTTRSVFRRIMRRRRQFHPKKSISCTTKPKIFPTLPYSRLGIIKSSLQTSASTLRFSKNPRRKIISPSVVTIAWQLREERAYLLIRLRHNKRLHSKAPSVSYPQLYQAVSDRSPSSILSCPTRAGNPAVSLTSARNSLRRWRRWSRAAVSTRGSPWT